jgi:hypothetical protein
MECKVASTSFFYLHFLLYRKSLRVLTRILHLFVSSLHQASEAFFIRYEQDGSRVCERLLHEKRSTFRHLAANLSEDGGKIQKEQRALIREQTRLQLRRMKMENFSCIMQGKRIFTVR